MDTDLKKYLDCFMKYFSSFSRSMQLLIKLNEKLKLACLGSCLCIGESRALAIVYMVLALKHLLSAAVVSEYFGYLEKWQIPRKRKKLMELDFSLYQVNSPYGYCNAKAQQITEKKSEPIVASSKSTKQAVECSPAVSAPKVDFAIDFFNMLSMDGPSVNSSEAASADDNAWASFQSPEGSAADISGSTELDAQKTHSSSGIEDLFQDSPYLVYAASEKPKKDAKTNIMSLYDKAQEKYLIRSYLFDNIMKSVKSQQEEDEEKVSKREGLSSNNKDRKNNKKANVKWSKHSVTE
ncbi:hypothetical protein RHMOL_Rhmol06G0173300 [Rhododendron molle]|uniref:Uncharacterized protein n=3 Tax=Rhododendron molle TaxID=49168 RepID=A0ACC0NDI2_RHOML|nr:hypothetical protein RHMOL_Rhmol06G0173300 [Rhododendron molle]KAI8551281.1 hypothetical protein RHMOL_Rhmol06G0173300 [Rhododendron molle]KAI8551282.1 hypothetical protein RHMOL_Rhmol06G0173300 [Rhododendron molle]